MFKKVATLDVYEKVVNDSPPLPVCIGKSTCNHCCCLVTALLRCEKKHEFIAAPFSVRLESCGVDTHKEAWSSKCP